VDDGSTDATAAVANSFAATHEDLPIRVLREPHRGPGAARNVGIRAARSEWIAFLDSDDLWYPEKLERMVAAIATNPLANFYCHNEVIRSLDGTESVMDYGAGLSPSEPLPRQLYRRNLFSTSAVVCRRDLLQRWNGFDEALTSAQDYELWLRMSSDLVPVFVRQVLGIYLMRPGNISTSRFWLRLVNILRVKHRHRNKGGAALYLLGIVEISLSHISRPLRAFINRLGSQRI
jgi:glycosyltransferase involved in cell wall biosynthesis